MQDSTILDFKVDIELEGLDHIQAIWHRFCFGIDRDDRTCNRYTYQRSLSAAMWDVEDADNEAASQL
jgi:hypothetical protein